MASKPQTLGVFTVAEKGSIPRTRVAISEEVITLAGNLSALYDAEKAGKIDVVGADTARKFIATARKAAEYAGLGLSVGVETSQGAMRAADLGKEADGVTYRLTFDPKVKTTRTRKDKAVAETPAE